MRFLLPWVALWSLAACDAARSGPDSFAPLPDTSEGLTNVSSDLDALLEHGALAGACDRYRAGARDRRSMLLCGKSMFFDEAFGTAGVPAVLAQLLVDNFPDQIGGGLSKLGMIEDPRSATHLPLGLPATTRIGGQIDALAFGCASCHFARLPDGRYAVGAPNHDYQYGQSILAMAVFPTVALLGGAQNHDPAAIAVIQPLLDRAAADPAVKNAITQALLPLVTGGGAMMPMFSKESEHHYASWRSGTMDFLIEPLPVDDKVHTISKISALWGIPDAAALAAHGLSSQYLAWTGGTPSLLAFARGFVSIGGGDLTQWPDDKLQPLVEYVLSLRTPAALTPPPADRVARGRQRFADKGCLDCHAGPQGGGTRLYDYEEIGTDPAMKRWLDPDGNGQACCGPLPPDASALLTHKLKSPRLTGAWAFTRFLHNGSLSSLEELFCMRGARGALASPYGDAGHDFTCRDLTDEDKRDLIAYLQAN